MNKGIIAEQSITINAPIDKVWNAFVDPAMIKEYMFDTEVSSEWKEGSAIKWKGEWQGKTYEDKGVILKLQKPHLLRYSHFSPMTGQDDVPENYHTVTIELLQQDDGVKVHLSQDNNGTMEAKEHSEKNWAMMLDKLKHLVES